MLHETPQTRMIVHPESSPCQGEIFHIICLARSDPVRVNFGLEIKKKRLEPKIENRSDLDETLRSHHQFSQIF